MTTPASTRDSLRHRKARGAFFTRPEISRFIATWTLRSSADVVLEPSCGEASFLLAAADQLRSLGGAASDGARQLHGIELHEPSAAAAARALGEAGVRATVVVTDFFDVRPAPRYDAVIGNPPYIRYQHFNGAARAKGLQAALAQGVRLTGLASSWAAFTIHAAQFLKPGGRLGLVLPAELLAVSYAAQVRRFLLERFGSVRLVMFEDLVFPGVLEEVVLLLAEGTGPAPCFEVYQARDVADLPLDGAHWIGFTPNEEGGKWTPALLDPPALSAYRDLAAGEGFTTLLHWGETDLGAVTGNNRFFALKAAEVTALKLRARDVVRVSPPGSRHLRGLSFTEAAWRALAESGARCFLLYPRKDSPSPATARYIAQGEDQGFHQAYKCRTRSPWWRVPLVRRPDLLLTYMDHDRPRLTTNAAKVYHLNSLYGVALRRGVRKLGRRLLPLACLNSVTLLGAEIVGRAYGGGLLKLEPSEADKLPVPSPELVRAVEHELHALRPQLTKALRGGNLMEAVQLVDRVILTHRLGATFDALRALRAARDKLFNRRITRGRSGAARGED